MLFAGWEVRMVKNCDRGLENTARGRRPRAAFSRQSDLTESIIHSHRRFIHVRRFTSVH